MMKKIGCRQIVTTGLFLAIMLILFPVCSVAQQITAPLQLTLEEARKIALDKNLEIKAAKIDASINALAIAEARLKKLPQLYADFNLQRNLIIPVTPVPANAFDSSAPEGKLLPLQFTTQWTSNSGLNTSVELFNPQNKLAIKEAEIREKITQLENTQLANDLSFEVGSAYVAALIAAEQLRLAEADTLTKASLAQMSQQQFDEGRLLLPTLNQVKANRNSTLNNYEEAQNIYETAVAQLLNVMGFAPKDAVAIVFLDTLETLLRPYQSNIKTNTLDSFTSNKQIQDDALTKAQIQAAVRGYLPSLTLKGYYGANYFDNNFEIMKSANWNGNSFVNLGVKVPILESLQRQKAISQLKLQQQANQLRYESARNKNDLEYASAIREAEVLNKNFLRAVENKLLAESNLRIAQQQFASGRLTISELNQVDYEYQKEKNSYLNLAYKYVSAVLNIENLNTK